MLRCLPFIIMLLFVWSQKALAKTTVLHLNPEDKSYALKEWMSLYRDTEHKLSIEDLLQQPHHYEFESIKKDGLGFIKDTLWLKLEADNPHPSMIRYTGSLRPDFYLCDVYLVQNGRVLKFLQLGTLSKERQLDLRFPLGRLEIPQGPFSLYFKVRSDLQVSLQFRLFQEQVMLKNVAQANAIFNIYFGCMFALLLYNFSLYCMLRYPSYLFYVLFAAAMLFNSLIQGGFLEFWEFPGISLSTRDAHWVISLPALTAMLFTRSFLHLKKSNPRFQACLNIGIALAMVFALLHLTPLSDYLLSLVSVFDLMSLVFVFCGGILALKQGDKTARVFLIGWGFLASSVFIWVLGNMGHIEKTPLIALAPLIGNMVEMVLMSIALALRIKQLEQQKIEAEMRAKEKDNLQHLLRMVCHDISNPVSIIKTVYYLALRRMNLRPDEQKHWERIKRATDSVEGIINQVRRFEAFRSGKLAFELRACSLRKVFEDIDFFFQTKAIDKGVRLSWRFMGAFSDLKVMADPTSLTHEVFNNIISNAIKFTGQGGVVEIEADRLKDFAIITIRDSGIGMPQDLIHKIFDGQIMTSRKGTNNESGTGFGMPLVKTFLEMFGGQIRIESVEQRTGSPGHGTTIEIKLPLAAHAELEEPQDLNSGSPISLS